MITRVNDISEEPRPELTDDQLIASMRAVPELQQDKNWHQLIELVMPMGPAQFFEAFFSDKAAFGLDEFGVRSGRSNIDLQPWQPVEGILERKLSCIVPVSGVPFVSKTRNEKLMRLTRFEVESSPCVVQIDMINRSLDIPQADSF